MFGVAGGEITAHGVGPKGTIPERTTLEYPMQGMKLQMSDTEYTAWAVKNKLTSADSYFLSIKNNPGSIIFGPMTENESADVFSLRLK
jgi:hypothetical protein